MQLEPDKSQPKSCDAECESQLEITAPPPASLPVIAPSNHNFWRVGTGKVDPDHSFPRAKSQPGPLESQKKSQSLAGGNFDFAWLLKTLPQITMKITVSGGWESRLCPRIGSSSSSLLVHLSTTLVQPVLAAAAHCTRLVCI